MASLVLCNLIHTYLFQLKEDDKINEELPDTTDADKIIEDVECKPLRYIIILHIIEHHIMMLTPRLNSITLIAWYTVTVYDGRIIA